MTEEVNIEIKIKEIERKLEEGEITLAEALKKLNALKGEYIKTIQKVKRHIKDPEQSWHSYIGKKFEKIIFNALKGYIEILKKKYPEFQGLVALTDKDITNKREYEVIFRKLAVKYGEYLLLPDTDIVIADYNSSNPWESKVLAIVSCKTSLRERIAQSCYWKLKLLSSDVTKHVKVYLVTRDNDEDFALNYDRKQHYGGKSRNRIIAEYELDGIYIVRDKFPKEWENEKVKRYDKLFHDLLDLIKDGVSRS